MNPRDYSRHELDALGNMKPNEKAMYQAQLDVKYALQDLIDEIRLTRRADNQTAQALKEIAEDKSNNKRLAKALRLAK